MAYKEDFNVFVGSRTGVFKGVKLAETAVIEKNLSGLKLSPEEDEITSMAWGDPDEREILLGLINQTVKVFNSESQMFTANLNVKCGEGPIRGVARYNGSILTAVESGEVKIWSEESTEQFQEAIKTGNKIDRMRHSSFNPEVIAVGGQEADLSLWNLEAKEKCIFKAKNVPHNFLQLRVPVWVSDIAFLPDGQKVATCSRHGHLRLYDPRAQRRPVINMEIPEQALTAVSSSSKEHHIIVGSGAGLMMLVDMRGKGLALNRYKGLTGSVRDIVCHPSEPYIVSVSLDRFLRLHHLETKALLHKVYLKSKLNCTLMRSDFSLRDVAVKTFDPADEDDDVKFVANQSKNMEATKEMDEIFGEMDAVNFHKVQSPAKKSKKSDSNLTDNLIQAKRKVKIANLKPHKRKRKA